MAQHYKSAFIKDKYLIQLFPKTKHTNAAVKKLGMLVFYEYCVTGWGEVQGISCGARVVAYLNFYYVYSLTGRGGAGWVWYKIKKWRKIQRVVVCG